MGLSRTNLRHHGFSICEDGLHRDARLSPLSTTADTVMAASWILFPSSVYKLRRGAVHPAAM